MTGPVRNITLTAAEERLLTDLPEGPVKDDLEAKGLPHRRVEAWKWSDIRSALDAPRDRSGPYTYNEDDEPLLSALGGFEIVLANGQLRAPAGVPAHLRVERRDAEPGLVPNLPMASLATTAKITDLRIDGDLGGPIFLRRLSDGEGSHADRVRIELAPNTHATVIETYRLDDSPFVNSLTEYTVGEGARLTRIVLQTGADGAVMVETAAVRIAEGGHLEQLVVTEGAGLCRHETRLVYEGRATAQIDGLYHLGGRRHGDISTHVDHEVPDSGTEQLVRGIVEGRARGVFQGKFHVARNAQRTAAHMQHQALMMSAEATVNAKPELEIYADDVECEHGNTVGALDDDALFYLRQRGLSEEAARSLLIEAFLAAVLERVTDETLRDALTQLVTEGD